MRHCESRSSTKNPRGQVQSLLRKLNVVSGLHNMPLTVTGLVRPGGNPQGPELMIYAFPGAKTAGGLGGFGPAAVCWLYVVLGVVPAPMA